MVHLKGQMQVELITFYGLSGLGWKGSNLRRFAKLGALLASLSSPWLVLGDFNMPYQSLQKAGFLTRVGAVVLQADVQTTRGAGKDGSHIDYGLCSPSCTPLLGGIWATAAVPWGTHLGLVARLRAGQESLRTRQLMMARSLPQAQPPRRGPVAGSRSAKQRKNTEAKALARQKELDLHQQFFGDRLREAERSWEEASTCSGSGRSSDVDSDEEVPRRSPPWRCELRRSGGQPLR